jgi:glycosyltransferase involved in cell wall biosynthesis
MKELSIIVPTYNEEAVLSLAVSELIGNLRKLNIRGEVLLIDDCSEDASGDIADTLSHRYPELKVIHHAANMMIGGALRTGISFASYENIILVPVDNILSSDQLKQFLTAAEHADIVCGYRSGRAGYSTSMRMLSKGYHALLVALFMVDLRDFTWIYLYKKRIFDCMSLKFNGIALLPEILIKAVKKGITITEIPCDMKPRTTGKATVSRPSRVIKLFVETMKLRHHIWFESW